MYRRYIDIDENSFVTAAFSDALRDPGPSSILIGETEERHFNPRLTDDDGEPVYRWDGSAMVERSAEERAAAAAPRKAKARIMSELDALDKVVPRSVEDLYKVTGKDPYAKVAAAISRKDELRAELAALEV